MNEIRIYGLCNRTENNLMDLYRNKIFTDIDFDTDIDALDVTLNENAIMKVYSDRITLDLGGVKSSIDINDFEHISVY